MVLPWGLEMLVTNVGIPLEWIILIITTLSCLPFFAKDFKLGIICIMVMQAGMFVWFYNVGLNYTFSLVMFFISLIILALSLFAVNSTSTTGGFN